VEEASKEFLRAQKRVKDMQLVASHFGKKGGEVQTSRASFEHFEEKKT